MPLVVSDKGRDNRIEIDAGVMEQGNGTVTLLGNGNLVRIESGCLLAQVNISLGENCAFEANRDCRLAAIEVVAYRHGLVAIGAQTKFTWHTRLYLHEPSRLTIGCSCLIAGATLLTTSDMHSILDLSTGTRINPAKDIVLGDRVWLASDAVVLKGSTIGTGSIVGFGSIVSGAIPEHVLCAGRPARPIRENVSWDEALL